jgi:hypothetical protein
VNETAALAAIAAALEAPARVNERAALAAVAAALEVPARPASAGGYLKAFAVPVIILAIIIGVAIVDDQQVRQDTNGHGSDRGKIEFKPEAPIQPLTGRQAAEGVSEPVGDQQVRQTVPKAPVLVKPPTVIEPTPQGILPPVQYDRPYEGDLTIEIVATAEELRMRCKIYDLRVLGCAFPKEKSCTIILVEDNLMRKRGWHMGILLRHEIGHCNGWSNDHLGARDVMWPVAPQIAWPDAPK